MRLSSVSLPNSKFLPMLEVALPCVQPETVADAVALEFTTQDVIVRLANTRLFPNLTQGDMADALETICRRSGWGERYFR